MHKINFGKKVEKNDFLLSQMDSNTYVCKLNVNHIRKLRDSEHNS